MEMNRNRLHRLRQQRPGTAAQHFGQWIGERPWLGKLENVSLGHGVSLLQWRSGGSNTPTIRRLTPSRRHQLSRIARVQGAENRTWCTSRFAERMPVAYSEKVL